MRSTQVISLISFAILASPALAQWSGREEILSQVEKTFGDPPGMTRLDPVSRVWADKKAQRVVVDGYIALQAGQLEMLACPAGTKEHESIVGVFSKARLVHAGLLAVGAKSGSPVRWEPKYTPPSGSEIAITALWKDAEGNKHSADARTWVRKLGTTADETLDVNFVFAGSGFWEDPETGKKEYLAESGDLICVSNFSTATLDIPMQSSDVNNGLMFAAFTERIPEKGTPVRLVLQVVPSKTASDAPQPAASRSASEPAASGQATPEQSKSEQSKPDAVNDSSEADPADRDLKELLGKP